MGTQKLDQNKRLVTRFFDEVIYGTGGNLDVLDELVEEDYVQHHSANGQGREGLRKFVADLRRGPLPELLDPQGTVRVNLIADGETVIRHEDRTHGTRIDIFRIQNGRLKDNWSAFRPIEGTERPSDF